MTGEDFERCDALLIRAEARAHLMDLNSAVYPHCKKSWQDKYHKALHQAAYPPEESAELSTEMLAALLGGRVGG